MAKGLLNIKAKCNLAQGNPNGSTLRFTVNEQAIPGQQAGTTAMRVADTVINVSYKDKNKFKEFEIDKEYTITIE